MKNKLSFSLLAFTFLLLAPGLFAQSVSSAKSDAAALLQGSDLKLDNETQAKKETQRVIDLLNQPKAVAQNIQTSPTVLPQPQKRYYSKQYYPAAAAPAVNNTLVNQAAVAPAAAVNSNNKVVPSISTNNSASSLSLSNPTAVNPNTAVQPTQNAQTTHPVGVEANKAELNTTKENNILDSKKSSTVTPEKINLFASSNDEDESNKDNLIQKKKDSNESPWLKVALSTLFICSSIVLCGYFLKKKNPGNFLFKNNEEQAQLKLIQTLPLGLKKEIHLLQLNQTQILISWDGAHLEMLHTQSVPSAKNNFIQSEVETKTAVSSNSQVEEFKNSENKNSVSLSKENLEQIIATQESVADKIRKAVRELKPLPALQNQILSSQQNTQSFSENNIESLAQNKTLSSVLKLSPEFKNLSLKERQMIN